ncbi:hypothetical protein DPMN_098190 [Dreissena polymorpha]|uniref:Uncharacterized protein n=1 Tax=Dreissena polymorpha TaxID=45954 RepID=A0A9D4LBP2_DREPO|nr:hypothetical protein DPMN_098190 [Dreissena polymorpha]
MREKSKPFLIEATQREIDAADTSLAHLFFKGNEESLARTSNGLNSAEEELQSPDWAKESIFIFMSTSSRKTLALKG